MRLERLAVAGLLILGLALAAWLARVYFVVPAESVHANHESYNYATRLIEFRDLLGAGYLSPQWATHFRAGLGSPYFGYYQPGVFYAASLVPWSVAPNHALGLTIMAFALLGYASMFSLVRRWFGTLSGGMAASLFLLSVYPATEIYIRGDLSEFCGMMLFAASLAALAAWMHKGRLRDVSFLALASAGMTVTHPAVGLVAHGFLGLLGLGLMLVPRTRARGVGALVGLGAGTAMASFYWFPVFFEWELVSPEAAFHDYYHYSGHFVDPRKLIEPYSREGPVPFTLGWIVPGLALINVVAVLVRFRRVTRAQRTVVLLGLAALVGTVFIMSESSAFVWEAVKTLQRLQFPWRVLALVTVFAAALAGAMLRWRSERWRAGFVGLVVLGAVFSAPAYSVYEIHPSLRVPPDAPSLADSYFAPDHRNEWMPRGAKIKVRRQAKRLPAMRPRGTVTDYRVSQGTLRAHVRTRAAAVVSLPHYYFPVGWEATLNGRPVVLAGNGLGLMRVSLPAGSNGTLEVRFTMTPMREMGIAVSGAAVFLGAALLFLLWHRRTRSAAAVDRAVIGAES